MIDPFGGIEPPSESIYYQGEDWGIPNPSKKCEKCGKIHASCVQNTRTGEIMALIDPCKDCFMGNAFTFNPIKEQITLIEE